MQNCSGFVLHEHKNVEKNPKTTNPGGFLLVSVNSPRESSSQTWWHHSNVEGSSFMENAADWRNGKQSREAVVWISADETIPGSKMRISSGSSLRSQHRQHFLGGRGCLMELVVPGAPTSHWNMEPGEELSWGKDDSPCSYENRVC